MSSISRVFEWFCIPCWRLPERAMDGATRRFLVALCLRTWGASEVCQYPELLTHILDPGSEVGRETSEWRYAAVQALAATVAQAPSTQTAALSAAASDIERSVRLGIYGSGGGGNFDIATRTG